MADLIIKKGQEVAYHGERYRIQSPIDLEFVVLENMATHEKITAKIAELEPEVDLKKSNIRNNTTDLVLIADEDWEEAKRRETVLKPLATNKNCPLEAAKNAGKELGLSWRQIYNLLKRYRDFDQELLALIPQKSNGGRGKARIQFIAEQIIKDIVDSRFLTNQRVQISLIAEDIARACVRAGVNPPSQQTVRRRIENISDKYVAERQSARHASKQYSPVWGEFPKTDCPHTIWQIDHTKVDLIIVDDVFRKPIGRPYLTLAIDTYSRCISGFYLSLDAPSSVSVGLCLTHAVLDKDEWLAKRKIKTQWPIWGKPDSIHVDNGVEFHSESLKRGCDAHGIKIIFRPIRQPHYGGIIERVIGTFMKLIHSLPGTTFSNVAEKADYPSDKKAVLTLSELEYWLTIAITDYYHQKIHRGIKQPPIELYKSAILGDKNNPGIGYPVKLHNKQAFLIDFLPIEWRTLQREGFMLDHISYNSPALSPFIANRKKYQQFLIRRDPRDLSRIYVLEPHSHRYLQVPYRSLSRPTITLWEHQRAIDWLNEKGIRRMNEVLIFQAIERMREITKAASYKTKSARRQQAKLDQHLKNAELNKPKHKKSNKKIINKDNNHESCDTDSIKPFNNIEIW